MTFDLEITQTVDLCDRDDAIQGSEWDISHRPYNKRAIYGWQVWALIIDLNNLGSYNKGSFKAAFVVQISWIHESDLWTVIRQPEMLVRTVGENARK